MKRQNIRLATTVTFGLAVGLALAVGPALAQDACTPGKTKRIAFMLKQQTAFRYLNADIPFFKKTAEAAGYEVIVQSAENDAQKQIGQAENVITQGVDAIVIQPVDFNVAAGIAEMATKAGIPLASYDDLILGAKQAGYIGRDPKDGGAEAARAVVEKVPKGNYVLIGGDAGQTGSTLMQQGYRDVLEPLAAKGDIKIVMDQFTPGWKTEPAQANAENALTANENKVDAFLVSYDGMSLGVLQAIEAAGIRVLDNEVTDVEGVQIVGDDYLATSHNDAFVKALGSITLDADRPTILLKHVPIHLETAERAGIDLQLSGHTHRAQIFPLSLITKIIFRGYDYELKPLGNMQVLTTSGVGTWGPPLRVGSNSEIVVITFE